MSLKKYVLVAGIPLILSACSSSTTELTSGGSLVTFVDTPPSSNCQYLGKAEGHRSSFFSGTKTHSELMRDAAKDLRNNAATMSGNTIFNAQDTSPKVISDLVPVDVTMTGEVYKCP
ncbi:DUF4156 domain-containing protein [Candidatus Schmidhempelia bombi]|uniref:DUF4156 domain-containing protein n=1 Tax=Candidatus Schmidhempelia bombi str. Bimp TaxID=1387197 RepID=A0AB94IC40_9GAMM|nr:DUF4156 domain-containing protein [Candidatus Schmidhempelia bombi]TEA26976.1 DUF4156 domain-containing protein [Candidatus Schmidhempelia bombi str. Bimp]